jgi:hypothetical protein
MRSAENGEHQRLAELRIAQSTAKTSRSGEAKGNKEQHKIKNKIFIKGNKEQHKIKNKIFIKMQTWLQHKIKNKFFIKMQTWL